MAKYSVRKDGLHEAIRTINGKRVAFRGRTDREVERKMREYKDDLLKGRYVKALVSDWEISREAEISESTRITYGFTTRRVVEAFGDTRASEITPQNLQKYLADFAKTHSRSSVSIEKGVLRMIFDYAVLSGDLEVSPADKLRVPKQSIPPKKRTALTDAQERALISLEARRTGDGVSFGYFLMFSGCRRGEALALNYSDIDRKAGVIHISKKISYAGGSPVLEDHLKSENGSRSIPLMPSLAAKIPKNRVGLLFPGKDGGPMKHSELQTMWRAYCREAGLNEIQQTDDGEIVETFPITPHCLRHNFATICYESGIDPRQTAEIVGDTPQVLEAVYTHLRDGKKRSAGEKLAEYVAGLERDALKAE